MSGVHFRLGWLGWVGALVSKVNKGWGNVGAVVFLIARDGGTVKRLSGDVQCCAFW